MPEKKTRIGEFPAERFILARNKESDRLNLLSGKLESLLNPSQPITEQIGIFFSLSANERAFLREFSEDRDLATAMAINVQSVRGRTRKSGRAYASHPAQVASTCLALATDISATARKQSAELALVHDVIEEDTLRALKRSEIQAFSYANFSGKAVSEVEAISQARESLNTLMPTCNAGDAVVTLMEPLVPEKSKTRYRQEGYTDYLITYAHFAELLRGVSNGAVINAEISDRIDDILDLGYILNSPSDQITKQGKLRDKFAKCLFTVNYMCYDSQGRLKDDVSRNLIHAFNALLKHVVTTSGYVTMETVIEEASVYNEFIGNNRSNVVADLNSYLSSTGNTLHIA